MKLTLSILLILILCAATAVGQAAGGVSSQPQMVVIPDHPQHADVHALASERPLVGGAADAYTYAKGERPLWEFGPFPPPKSQTPLGDVARAVRKEKLTTKKAEIVLEKQGS